MYWQCGLLRWGLLCGFLFGLSSVSGFVESFRYEGFSIETNLSTLMKRFPLSGHEFWYSDGQIKSVPDGAAEIRDSVAHDSGQYIIRLANSESVGHLHFISAHIAVGALSRLRLSFEKPGTANEKFLVGFENRHPACAPILADLTKRYGKPRGPEIGSEERLESWHYTWNTAFEDLTLVCGHYQGRRSLFAMEVLLSRLPND